MSNTSAKIGISNDTTYDRTVLVEAWADAYILPPGDTITVVAQGKDVIPFFNIVEWDSITQVYCENTHDFYVERGGKCWQLGVEI